MARCGAMVRSSRVFVIVALLAHAGLAHAGGYSLLPRGARNLGRGGASVAGLRDLSAAWMNPAILAHLRGVHVLADVGMGIWQLSFARSADPAISPHGFAPVENMAPPTFSPSVFLGWDFGLDWFQVTFGFFGPYGGDVGFDSMSSARYTLVYLDMFEATYQLAVAFRPFSWLAIGAAFQIRDVRMTQAVKLTVYTGFDTLGPPESTSDDVLTEIDVAKHINPSGLFGIWVGPADWVDLGLSVQLPMRVQADGTASVTLPTDNPLLRDAYVEGDQVSVHINTATVIRAGVALRFPHRFEVEVDTWAEIWEPHEDIFVEAHDVVVRNVEGGVDLAVNDMSVPQDWHVAFGAAAGAEWETIEDRLSLRLGVYYDSGGVPDHTVSVGWFDSHKFGLSLGLTVEVWRFAFDIAYSHLFFVPRDISTSQVRQLCPLEPQRAELLTVVGNGRYESSLDVVALTVRAAF